MSNKPGTLNIGEEFGFGKRSKTSRRRFLKALGISGSSLIGLRNAIEIASGKDTEGVPLVLTKDLKGNPDRVRMVSKERYRRLKTYERFPVRGFIENYPFVNNITLSNTDEEDITFTAELEEVSQRKKNRLPNNYNGIEIKTTERPGEYSQDCEGDDNDNGCSSHQQKFNDIVGGIQIQPEAIDGVGTLAFVGYQRTNPTAVTAAHVVEENGIVADYVEQGGRRIGEVTAYNEADDVAAIQLHSYVTSTPREIHDPYFDVSGVWTFSGLSDEVSRTDVHAQFAGRTSCFDQDYVRGTSKNNRVEHQVGFENNKANGGDSGAAWVDDDNKLIGIHSGNWDVLYDCWDAAACGGPALDKINVSLY